jgi:hypothetical protein
MVDIWYNKWAGGDREDNYSKYVFPCLVWLASWANLSLAAKPNPRRAAASRKTLD